MEIDKLPDEGTPEMDRLRSRISGIKFVLQWLDLAENKEERKFQLAQLKEYGFVRAVDAQAWLRGLQQIGFDARSMTRFELPKLPQRRE